MAIPIYLEVGQKSVFAVAIDWPGWCRRAKDPAAAIEELDAYRERYASICGRDPGRGGFDVIGELVGNATTDFGAPSSIGPWDEQPMSAQRRRRSLELLQRHWDYFDATLSAAPLALRKGPRGGGRDRDAVRDHVREAERAYCAKVGVRIGPRTAWSEQRSTLLSTLEARGEGGSWPLAYAIRRMAWHVADHAWEIEDKGVALAY
ncbi:MAG: hypothetical protein HKL86_08510 [Acidimicrobiaceae bacterium]|nr:hypothetical protein [Acidimicrobiaceae bacterium]